jgi:hypothetical protein
MDMKSHKWADIELRAVALAWSDDQFKRALMEDSRGALRAYFDYEVPDDVKLVVTDGSTAPENALHIVIPPRPLGLSDGRVEITPDAGTAQALQRVCCACC